MINGFTTFKIIQNAKDKSDIISEIYPVYRFELNDLGFLGIFIHEKKLYSFIIVVKPTK